MKLATLVVAGVLGLSACGDSGGSWSEVDVPKPAFVSVYTVWPAADNDVWLGGSSMWHYDGSDWTEVPPPVASGIVNFWGFAPNNIFAIGDAHVFHWDGAAWTEIPANNGVTFQAMWRVWGASPSDVYIANQDNSRVYHYDGATWTVQTLQFVMADALWGSGPDDIWLTGLSSIYHYDGTSWRQDQTTTNPHGGYGIWGFGANDVWVAGGFDELSHWNGSTWEGHEDIDGSFNGVWGAASNDVYAVGDNGRAGHWDGSSWSVSDELGVRENFTMVHGSSASNIWATAVDPSGPRALVLRHDD